MEGVFPAPDLCLKFVASDRLKITASGLSVNHPPHRDVTKFGGAF